MSSVFLVLAHRDPDQLARLLGELVGSSRRVYVHVDARVDLAPFRAAIRSDGVRWAGVHWVRDRRVVRWGGLSVVDAILASIAQARGDGPVHRYTLLSGSCFPVRPVEEIGELPADVEHLRIDRTIDPAGGVQAEKLNRRWFNDSRLLRRWGGRLPAQWPRGLPPVKQGSAWWSLTAGCVHHVLTVLDDRPELRTAFRQTHCPDELVLPTIIAASPYADRIERRQRYDLTQDEDAGDQDPRHGLHYINWSPDGWSPAWLTAADLPAIRASGAHFARKIDSVRSADLLAQLP